MLKMRAEMIQGKRREVVPKLAAHTQKINLLADKDWLDLIDEYRKRQGFPTPTRSDAIRRLVDQALEANGIKHKPKKPKG
jgi:metal-responsive CopG/Arc/MetJ family transcriptional regulator